MKMQLFLFLLDAFLINLCYIFAFLIRYGADIPESSILPYKKNFLFITLIYACTFFLFNMFKKMFRSSWNLFKRVFSSLFFGTLLSIVFVYIFRENWGAFPTSVFAISFFVNLLLIYKCNLSILKRKKRIKKQVVVLGDGRIDDFVGKKAILKRKSINQIQELLQCPYIDEIIVTENIINPKDLNLLLYVQQKFKAEILFSPAIYMNLLPQRINGNPSIELGTFVGRRSDLDEFLIKAFDKSVSLILLILAFFPMLLVAVLIKLTSKGEIIYKQERVGKDGKGFVLYKFRTMVQDAEKMAGFLPAQEDDARITKFGRILRITRLDELPQLMNVLLGDMSLVGPRPENFYRVFKHKALQGIRLAVKPGLTGLAQVRSFYDLHPKHKIKYDYLYIQRRSFLLNAYLLLQTIPVVFLKKGR